jgi:hypothetical protein
VNADDVQAVGPAVDPTAAGNGPAQAAGMLHLASAELASHEGRARVPRK